MLNFLGDEFVGLPFFVLYPEVPPWEIKKRMIGKWHGALPFAQNRLTFGPSFPLKNIENNHGFVIDKKY